MRLQTPLSTETGLKCAVPDLLHRDPSSRAIEGNWQLRWLPHLPLHFTAVGSLMKNKYEQLICLLSQLDCYNALTLM